MTETGSPTEQSPMSGRSPAPDGSTELRAGQWVVLIYMAVTSPELRDLMERDLAEMATRLRLLQHDPLRVYAMMDTPDGKFTVRHALHRTPETEPAIMRFGQDRERRLGRKGAFLAEFIQWRFNLMPETEPKKAFEKTLLILWGHSQGVATALSRPGSPAYAMVGNGGFGFNEFTGDSLSLPQIRQAIADGLPDGKHIDILSFDSCFMSAAEVSAEFQGTCPDPDDPEAGEGQDKAARVNFVVASQSAVLLDGLEYGRLVDVFIDKGSDCVVSPEDLGRGLLEQASSTTDSPVSLSLLYTGGWKEDGSGPYQRFSEALRRLVVHLSLILDTGTEPPTPHTPPERPRLSHRPEELEAIRTKIGKRRDRSSPDVVPGANRSEWLRIRDAFESATWHRVRQFIDVADLCRRLANNSRTPELRDAALAVLGTLQPASHTADVRDSLVVDVRSLHPLQLSGMSLYCPWLFPTPEEVRKGAWNAVVDLYDYATSLWFNRGAGSWGAFVYHAKHVLEESRQRAINTEIADLRLAAARGSYEPAGTSTGASAVPEVRFRDKGGRDGFQVAEPEQMELDPTNPPGFRASTLASAPSRAKIAARAAAQGSYDQVSICPKR
jgi:hypothetical protein